MKINRKFENAIYDNLVIKPDDFDQEVNFGATTEQLKTVTSFLAHSTVNILSDSFTEKEMPTILNYLDAKIAASRKTATIWDAFNIRYASHNKDEFINQYASLPNNSGLIIDADDININDKIYKRGDIVVKDFNSNEIIIKSSQTGYYKPDAKLTLLSNGIYQITFNYQDGIPQTESDKKVNIEIDPSLTPEIEYYYNKSIVLNSNAISDWLDFKYKDNKFITPIWESRIFVEQNSFGEVVYNAAQIEYDNNKFRFVNNTNLSIVVLCK